MHKCCGELTPESFAGKFNRDVVLVKTDPSKKCVRFIGHPKALKELLQQADKHIAEYQRVSKRKSQMKRLESVDKIRILETQGTFEEVCTKFADMQIRVRGNEVIVEGDPGDLKTAFVQILEEYDSIQPGKYKHYKSKEFVNFVNSKAIKKHVQDNLNRKQFKGRWEINSKDIVVFSAEGSDDPHSLCREILNLVNEERIPIDEDVLHIFDAKDWKTFKDTAKRNSKDKLDIALTETPEVIILGIQDIKGVVKDVKSWIDDRTIKEKFIRCDPVNIEFICKCWKQDDFSDIENTCVKLSVKKDGILISGTSKDIEAAESELETRLKQFCRKSKTLERTAICDVIMAAKGQGTLKDIEEESRCLLKLPGELEGESFIDLYDTDHTGPAQVDEKGDSGK